MQVAILWCTELECANRQLSETIGTKQRESYYSHSDQAIAMSSSALHACIVNTNSSISIMVSTQSEMTD